MWDLLLLLYINVLPFSLSKAHMTMYADDTAISFSSNNIEEIKATFTRGRSNI